MSDLIKWSGSKNSQAKNIISFFPKNIDTYYEPLLGGGSIFLALLESLYFDF
jgi:DNA adenine methylase